ncbi:LacI family transcriptional regulator [Lachnospiraceae bacterium PM6-15]|uniref:LacI family DNA-binding transcriptional regulator n=1 Tax=Ohessyouella blattaphilus TaxID=2949333 RepID=UPI003E2F9A87
MRMTLKKLGEMAGVSSACVSNILNGKTEEYSEETVTRVRNLANEYNYRPNSIAKSMVTKFTMTIGLILPDITNPYFPELAKGVERKAFELGYSVIYLNSDEDAIKEKKAFRTLEQKMVDGIIFIPSVNSVENKEIFDQTQVPIVTVDRPLDIEGTIGEVVADDYKGSRMATKYLIENGYKHILFLSGDRHFGIHSDRARGFGDEMKAHGLSLSEDYFIVGKYDAEFGYQAIHDFLELKKPVDAVYAGSDMIAIGAMQALKDNGLSIPGDVSIVGYDDIYISQYLDPPLTTINQPKYQMGAGAVEMLIKLIEKQEKQEKLVLSPELVVRKSVKKTV